MTYPSDYTPGGKPITGRTVLFGMVAFFGVIIGVNLVFVYFALDSWPGLTTDQAYEEGLAYNETLEGATKQGEMGWISRVSLAPPMPKGGRLLLVSLDGPEGALSGLDVSAHLSRPLGEGLDVTVTLSEEKAGRYGAMVRLPAPGRWRVDLTARTRDGRGYRMLHEIQAGGSGR